MAKTPVYMPKFGMTMVEAEIVEWYVQKGDMVSQGDPLCSIETEKTTVDIIAPEDGYVGKLLFKKAESAEVGTIILNIFENEDEIEDDEEVEKEQAPQQEEEAKPADTEKSMSRMRRIIADNMRSSLQNSAQLTHFREECIDNLVEFKKGLEDVSYNDLLLKIFALAAVKYEKARTQLVGDKLIVKEDINIGLAVALEDGLIVPVIKNVDKLALKEISEERKRITEAARKSMLTPDETGNAIGTLSTLGLQQVDCFTPILNPPESVIFGIGRITVKPWVKDGAVVPANVMTLSLTFDHQVLDGKDAAEFLDVFVKILQTPVDSMSAFI